MPRKVFSLADRELVRLRYADTPTDMLTTVCGCTVPQMYALAHRMGLKKSPDFISKHFGAQLAETGKDHRFKKGQVPPNKGIKRPGYAPGDMASTQFKKGQMPHTWMPVGSYRLVKQGPHSQRQVLEVKFSEAPGPYTNRWIPVHRRVWIEANGPVPAGHVIAFKPGRFSNQVDEITLDALECITNADNVRRNSLHTLPPELAAVHRLRGVLTRAINRKQKEQQQS